MSRRMILVSLIHRRLDIQALALLAVRSALVTPGGSLLLRSARAPSGGAVRRASGSCTYRHARGPQRCGSSG